MALADRRRVDLAKQRLGLREPADSRQRVGAEHRETQARAVAQAGARVDALVDAGLGERPLDAPQRLGHAARGEIGVREPRVHARAQARVARARGVLEREIGVREHALRDRASAARARRRAREARRASRSSPCASARTSAVAQNATSSLAAIAGVA